ncbi:MAG: BatD family protein [Chloroflexota bacterium]
MIRQLVCLVGVFWLFTAVSAQDIAPFAEGSVDNMSPYVGEPVTYTLRIYTPEAIENSMVTEPSFFGFGRSDTTFEPTTSTETVDGQVYSVITQRYLLYPIRSGDMTIDPFTIDVPETPFGAGFSISTNALTVDVQAFPEPVPETFINAVGQFTISASATPTQLTYGGAFTLTVAVTGSGNIERLLAPLVTLPEGWQLFAGDTSLTEQGLGVGSKTFTWTVIANGSGNVVIPAVVLSSFNPQTGTFETQETRPITLNITGNAESDAPVVRTLVPLPTVFVPELRTETTAIETSPLPITPPIWFWGLWFVPPLFVGGMWLIRRPRTEKQASAPQSPARNKRAKNIQQLKACLQALQDNAPKDAYADILVILLDFIGTKTGSPVTLENLEGVLSDYPAGLRAEVMACAEEASAAQYAPVTREDVRHLSQRVLRVCVAIEKARAS